MSGSESGNKSASLFPHPGPSLPPFRTLLIKGSYHSSAPLHLCLSHTGQNPNSKTVLLTPSRQNLVHALTQYHDDRSTLHSEDVDITSKIDFFYPPSPAHLALLLAMFHRSSEGSSFHAKTTFDVVPALLILLEPSLYFLTNDSEQSYTISSYLTLISHALTAVSFLSLGEPETTRPALAVFDSQLDRLKLPILRSPLESLTNEDERHDRSPRQESVLFFAVKFFDWMVNFEKGSHPPQVDNRKRMVLYRTAGEGDATAWEWSEVLGPARDGSERQSRVFRWP